MINLLLTRILLSTTPFMLCACSSIMTHAGPTDGYYPGSKNSLERIKDDETGWVMKPLLAIDLPFTAVLDTLLIPLDYVRADNNNDDDSPKKRIDALEKQAKADARHNKSNIEDDTK